MKHKISQFFTTAVLLLPLLACDQLFPRQEDPGRLTIHFITQPSTRAAQPWPDSSRFLLKVISDEGKTAYEGFFGDCPDPLPVDPGTYLITVRSSPFNPPEFDVPLYGDDQVAVVSPGASVDVALHCTQVNAGIRLAVAPDFRTHYPEGLFRLRSSDGSLSYPPEETRIAYFHPGPVTILLDNQGAEEELYTRSLEPREVLTVAISAPGSDPVSSGHITVAVDTTRNWTGEEYVFGSGVTSARDGRDKDHAMDVVTAQGKIGETGVWVYGYILGNASPFLGVSSETNLVIAGRTSVTSKESCMSVELKKGAVRDALNILSHPENKGRKVFLKGDLATYYGMPGVKNVTECYLDD